MSDNTRTVIIVVVIIIALFGDNMYNNYVAGQIAIAKAACAK